MIVTPTPLFSPLVRRRSYATFFVFVYALAGACAAARETSPVRAPLPWLADDGSQAWVAVRLLQDAASHGLDPERYGASDLQGRLEAPRDPAAAAALERDLGAAMLRYLGELHGGQTVSVYRRPGDDPGFAPQPILEQAFAARELAQAVDAAVPAVPLYPRVKASLAHYRALARRHPQWETLPAAGAGGPVEEGDQYAGAALLRARLQLLEDLDPGDADAAGGDTYSAAMADAVRRFQARHGLAEDGVLGPQTLAALAIPPAQRAVQLALTLERLRWLPRLPRGRMVAVNLPAYRLWAFDSGAGAANPPLEMRIIVGTAARTQTPLFIGQMRYLEFNPYWNVPRSIAVGEILPKLARDPGYLAKNDMELVGAGGTAGVRTGTSRIRQRPGARNVLGALKFAMPNRMNIYLHSTSAKELFDRSRRDLSHGCIRVEDPVRLARFVLADEQAWDTAAIDAAIATGKTRTVALPVPVPVVLFYATAVTGRDGRTVFADDIYSLDAALTEALGLRDAAYLLR